MGKPEKKILKKVQRFNLGKVCGWWQLEQGCSDITYGPVGIENEKNKIQFFPIKKKKQIVCTIIINKNIDHVLFTIQITIQSFYFSFFL